MLGVKDGTEFGEFSQAELDLLTELRGFLYFNVDAWKDDLRSQPHQLAKLVNETEKPLFLTVHHLTEKNQSQVTSFLKQVASPHSRIQLAYRTHISHQDDDETLIENAGVYCSRNQTARSFAPRLPVSVGPVQFDPQAIPLAQTPAMPD